MNFVGWIGVAMARKINGHHVEIMGETVDLIPPRVGAASAAVDQGKSLAPKRPSPALQGITDCQFVDRAECAAKSLRWLAYIIHIE